MRARGRARASAGERRLVSRRLCFRRRIWPSRAPILISGNVAAQHCAPHSRLEGCRANFSPSRLAQIEAAIRIALHGCARFVKAVGVSPYNTASFDPGFPFWILAASILRSFSLEGKPFLTAGTHRAGPKCLHWTLSFSEGDNSSVGRQFFRHSSELHSAASRFRTRERPFYPLGSGSAQILCSMSPNSLRFRCPSANNNQ